MLDKSIINELQIGLREIVTRSNSPSDKRSTNITQKANDQLQKAILASLVRGDITFVSLIEDKIGAAWSVTHGEDDSKLYYFLKHA